MKSDLIWIVAGRILIGLISLIALRVSTQLLVPEQYGVFVIMLTFQAIIAQLLINPTLNFIKKEANNWILEKQIQDKIHQFKNYSYFGAVFGSSLVLLWSVSKGFELEIIIFQTFLSFIFVISSASITISTVLLQMVGLRKASIKWFLINVMSGLLISWLLISFYASGLFWLTGQFIGITIGAIGANKQLKKHLPINNNKKTKLLNINIIKKFIVPLMITYTILWWSMYGYRLIFESYWGLETIGYFAVSYGLANQIWTLIDSITSQFLLPLYFKAISEKKTAKHALSDLINTVIPVYLVITSAMLISYVAILKILVSPIYSHLAIFLFFGFMAESCRVMTDLFSFSSYIKGRMHELIVPYSVGGIFLAIGIFYIISNDGDVEDTLIVLFLSWLFALLTIIIRMKQKYNFNIDYLRWFIGFSLVISSIIISINYPIPINSISSALLLIIIVGIISLAVLALLIWKNKNINRLLNIELYISKSKNNE